MKLLKHCQHVARFSALLALAPFVAVAQHGGYVIVESEMQSPYMKGFPPPDDRLITRDDHFSAGGPEVARWSYQNMSQIRAVDVIPRGGQILELPYADRHLLDETFVDPDGAAMSLRDLLKAMQVDGFVVLKDGVVQTEAYYNGLTPDTHHIAFSVTKSFVGALVLSLVEDGLIKLDARAQDYLPELETAAIGRATVRQVLDMRSSLNFDLLRQRATNSRAGGFTPRPDDFEYTNTLDWVASLPADGVHGLKYTYNPANTEVLGWIATRVLNQNWQDALAERIWKKLGAEHDALIVVDEQGHGFATAGLNATLRDYARFGLMIAQNGAINGQRVLSQASIDDIRYGDDAARAAWQGSADAETFGSDAFYRNQFRTLNSDTGEVIAVGASGQMIYVNIDAGLVGVFLSTGAGDMDGTQIELMREIGTRIERD